MKIFNQIEKYIPYNEQEARDKKLILSCFNSMQDIFTRKNPIAHMTASAWVVNKEHTKVLMAYHKIYDSWAWLGGHADGEHNLLKIALKEAMEESGVKHIHSVSEEIYSLEVLTVDGHMKNGEYVSSHLHLNVTYLLEADEDDVLIMKEDENSGVAWFTFEEALKASTEPWFVEHIYSKLIEKMQSISN